MKVTEIKTFLEVLEAETFDCRLIHSTNITKPKMKYTLSPVDVVRYSKFFAARNIEGYHVFCRPLSFQYVLIDDLRTKEQLYSLKPLRPCMLIETSPNNYQAWLKLPEMPQDREIALQLCVSFAELLQADKGAAKPEQLGRLPGFSNRKPKYYQNGKYPLVRLRKCENRVAEFDLSLFLSDSGSERPKTFATSHTNTESFSQSHLDWYLINRGIALGYSDAEIETMLKSQLNFDSRKKSRNYISYSIEKARRKK